MKFQEAEICYSNFPLRNIIFNLYF